MLLELLITGACLQGNSDSCSAGLNGYVKYYKLDDRAQEVEQKIKRRYPAIHLMGFMAGSAVHKKFNGMLYKNIWLSGDYTDSKDPRSIIYYKFSF